MCGEVYEYYATNECCSSVGCLTDVETTIFCLLNQAQTYIDIQNTANPDLFEILKYSLLNACRHLYNNNNLHIIVRHIPQQR